MSSFKTVPSGVGAPIITFYFETCYKCNKKIYSSPKYTFFRNHNEYNEYCQNIRRNKQQSKQRDKIMKKLFGNIPVKNTYVCKKCTVANSAITILASLNNCFATYSVTCDTDIAMQSVTQHIIDLD